MYVFNNIIYKEVYDSIKNHDEKMVSYLIDFALRHHYVGNILKVYIAYMLAYNENPFSVSCENEGEMLGNHKVILEDFKERLTDDNFQNKKQTGIVKKIPDRMNSFLNEDIKNLKNTIHN